MLDRSWYLPNLSSSMLLPKSHLDSAILDKRPNYWCWRILQSMLTYLHTHLLDSEKSLSEHNSVRTSERLGPPTFSFLKACFQEMTKSVSHSGYQVCLHNYCEPNDVRDRKICTCPSTTSNLFPSLYCPALSQSQDNR